MTPPGSMTARSPASCGVPVSTCAKKFNWSKFRLHRKINANSCSRAAAAEQAPHPAPSPALRDQVGGFGMSSRGGAIDSGGNTFLQLGPKSNDGPKSNEALSKESLAVRTRSEERRVGKECR